MSKILLDDVNLRSWSRFASKAAFAYFAETDDTVDSGVDGKVAADEGTGTS